MNVNFKYNDADKNDVVVFEQIFAEVEGGGLVSNPSFDAPAGTAVGEDNNGKLKVIKAYKVVEAANSSATSIKIAKGSGIESGDVIGVGTKSVASTAVDKTNASYDTVTVTLGVAVAVGQVLYQSASASANSAAPYLTPKYLIGNAIFAGEGDQAVRLINGANVRKDTANVSSEVVAKMKGIFLV